MGQPEGTSDLDMNYAWPAMTFLAPLSDSLATTRRSLHLIAFYAFSFARQQADGEVWLTPTPGGLGTPSFDGRVLRFEEADLVSQSGCNILAVPISTLRDALVFAGVEYDRARGERNDIEVPDNLDEVLNVEVSDVAFLGDYFSFGQSILEDLVAGAPDGDDTAPRLWAEHFDLAIELGDEGTKSRASVGFSPGDAFIPEPYAYVAPWWKDETRDRLPPTEPFGVALRYSDLLETQDPRALVLSFLGEALSKLSH